MKKKKVEYRGGRIKLLVEYVAKLIFENPTLEQDTVKLHTVIRANVPGYGRKEDCFNCGRSMMIREFVAEVKHVELLVAMAREVRRKVEVEHKPFTEANYTHVPSLPVSDQIRHCVTSASYLGFVVQPEKISQSGHWIITKWGWKALRGEDVLRSAKYWRGTLLERGSETTTLQKMRQTYLGTRQRAFGQKVKVGPGKPLVESYSPNEWAPFVGYVEESPTLI